MTHLPRLVTFLGGLRTSNHYEQENCLAVVLGIATKSLVLTKALAKDDQFMSWMAARLVEVSDTDVPECNRIDKAVTVSSQAPAPAFLDRAVARRNTLLLLLRTLRDGSTDPVATAKKHEFESRIAALSRDDSEYVLVRETGKELLALIKRGPHPNAAK